MNRTQLNLHNLSRCFFFLFISIYILIPFAFLLLRDGGPEERGTGQDRKKEVPRIPKTGDQSNDDERDAYNDFPEHDGPCISVISTRDPHSCMARSRI